MTQEVKQSTLEIQKILVVSTGHLPDAERMMLDRALSARMDRGEKESDFPVVDPVGSYGWRVCVDSQWPVQAQAPALYQGLELARANGCQWLQYDRDADQIEQLPTFED